MEEVGEAGRRSILVQERVKCAWRESGGGWGGLERENEEE